MPVPDFVLDLRASVGHAMLWLSGATAVIRRGRRPVTVARDGSNSAIVWNPWIDKAAAMADFGNDEWTGMVCVETANVKADAVTLEPGASHTMTAYITV